MGPGRQRVDLDHLALLVVADDGRRGPRVGLVAAQAAHPGLPTLQGPLERLDLAHPAAQVGVAVVQLRTVLDVLLLHAQQGQDGAHVDWHHGVVGVAGADGLGEVVAGVEEEHVDPGDGRAGEVGHHRVTHRARHGERLTEGLLGPAQRPPGHLDPLLVGGRLEPRPPVADHLGALGHERAQGPRPALLAGASSGDRDGHGVPPRVGRVRWVAGRLIAGAPRRRGGPTGRRARQPRAGRGSDDRAARRSRGARRR